MKVYWFAYRQLFPINIAISAALSIFSPNLYPITFATFGYAFTLYIYLKFYKNAWYIFLNLGYTKTSIILFTSLINVFIALILSPLLWII